MKNDNLLIEGGVLHVLLASSVPFLAANVIQALYEAVDLMVIGWYCTPASVAAASTETQVTQIITSMVSGLALGGTILAGKCTGMKDEKRACRTTGTTLSVFAVAALVLTVGVLIFRDTILAALKTPATSVDEARQYVTICFCGIFFICDYSAINAILWGYGDSRRPMYFVAMSYMLNIANDVILVKYLGLGVADTALAIILSQSISMICSIVYLNRERFVFTFTPKNLCVDRGRLKGLAMVGIPISSQECMMWLSLLYLTSATNRLGVNATVAAGITSKYGVFAVLPATSTASVLAVITAQSYGAGRPERARRSLTAGIDFAALASSVFFLQTRLPPRIMIGLFNTSPDIVEAGVPFLHSYSFDYPAVSFVFCPNGFMNGRSKTVFIMVGCCSGALAPRIPLI